VSSEDTLSPLIQLNLFLHMALDYPESSPFNPILHKRGYRIKSIGRIIPVPLEVRSKLDKSEYGVNQRVVPEIIFENTVTGHLLLLECKSSAFSSGKDSRDTRQAIAYLSLPTGYLSDFLGQPHSRRGTTQVVYSVKNTHSKALRESLDAIADYLREAGLTPLRSRVVGLSSKDSGVYLCVEKGGNTEELRIASSTPLANSAALYLIPIDPDINLKDEYGHQVMSESVVSALRTVIGGRLGITEIKFHINEFCQLVVPVWELWTPEPKKKLRQLIRHYINQVSEELRKKGLKIVYENGVYTLPLVGRDVSERVRGYLRSSKFNDVSKRAFGEDDQLVIESVEEQGME
jgi:hypothetical protein